MAVKKVIALARNWSPFFQLKSFTSERKRSPIRLFHVPTINTKADVCDQLAKIETCSQQSPAIAHLTNDA